MSKGARLVLGQGLQGYADRCASRGNYPESITAALWDRTLALEGASDEAHNSACVRDAHRRPRATTVRRWLDFVGLARDRALRPGSQTMCVAARARPLPLPVRRG